MVNRDTILSFFVQVPIRNKPKRSRSTDIFSDINDTTTPSTSSSQPSSSSGKGGPLESRQATLNVRIDSRIKIVLLCCALCTAPLIRNQWVLDRYYTRSTTSSTGTTTSNSRYVTLSDVIDGTKSLREPPVKVETERNLDGATMQSQSHLPTLSPNNSIRIKLNVSTPTERTPVPTNTTSSNGIKSTSTQTEQPSGYGSGANGTTTTTATQQQSTIDSNNNNNNSTIIVVQWNHWTDLEKIVGSIWGGNLFCTTIENIVSQYYADHTITMDVETNSTDPITNQTSLTMVQRNVTFPTNLPIPTIHFGIELSCYDLFVQSTDGTGNYIEAIYMMRLSLKYLSTANIQLNITCIDNTVEFQTNYVLPWFTGVWYSPHYDSNSNNHNSNNKESIQFQGQPYDNVTMQQRELQTKALPVLTSDQYCGTFKTVPTAIMAREMQYDVRRMAIALTCNTKLVGQGRRSSTTLVQYPHKSKVLNFLQRRIYYIQNDNSVVQQSKVSTTGTSGNQKRTHIYADNQQERIPLQMHLEPLIKSTTSSNTKDDHNHKPDSSSSSSSSSGIDFDDAVIHFRCGDLLSTTLSSYGFLTFRGYSRHINAKTTRSIGILTQPFGSNSSSTNKTSNTTTPKLTTMTTMEQKQARALDYENDQQVERCRTLVYAFVEHLENEFPNTTITIRNDKSETIALAYARMVLAQQVIGAMSTFSLFPILGTFGTGYYLRPKIYDPSMWLTNNVYPITKQSNIGGTGSGLKLFNDNNIMVGSATRDLWDRYGDDVVLQWFRTGNYTLF